MSLKGKLAVGNIKRRRPQNTQPAVVGYGSPPQHSRWKPGQSGNPKGRPKGSRNFKTDVQATLHAPVHITRNGKPQKVSTQSAVLLRLRENALKGDARAIEKLVELARSYNSEEFVALAGLSVEDENVLKIYRERVLSGAADVDSELSEKSKSDRDE